MNGSASEQRHCFCCLGPGIMGQGFQNGTPSMVSAALAAAFGENVWGAEVPFVIGDDLLQTQGCNFSHHGIPAYGGRHSLCDAAPMHKLDELD